MGHAIALDACAKLNLGLRVLGARPDGFHELHTHLQAIDLRDALRLEAVPRGVTVETAPALDLPPEQNLAYRAAALFFSQTGVDAGARIQLSKRIPLGAGLGGGSSDAAATLVGLNQLFETDVPLETLEGWAARLGSDAPFFVRGGRACARGRGERLAPWAPSPPASHFVILVPPVHAATPEVYRAWGALGCSGEDAPCGALGWANDLEPAALACYPELAEVAAWARASGAPVCGMSGSGSAFYAGFTQEGAAQDFSRRSKKRLPQVQVFLAGAR